MTKVLCAGALVAVAGLASAETITIRSGTGSVGQPDVRSHVLTRSGLGPFPNLFTSADFAAARGGPAGFVHGAEASWVSSMAADASARWVGSNTAASSSKTGLFAYSFYVSSAHPQTEPASLAFSYAAATQIGGGPNQGVYINGQPLSGGTSGGSPTVVRLISRDDIAPLLVPGWNWLYVNHTASAFPSGLMFSATIQIGEPICAGPQWGQPMGSGPSARKAPAMVYDSLRSRMVLYGGEYQGLSDTWTWDSGGWSPWAIAGPPGREEHAMAYDAARDRVVLFGGWNQGSLGDMWELSAAGWSQVIASGPAARASHGMVFDSARGRVVLFGGAGAGGSVLGDTWEWDGATWVRVATTGPSPRYAFGMAYDSGRARTVLFGGLGGSGGGFLGDTWEWDGTAWMLMTGAGPSARGFESMTYDSARGRVLLFGGEGPGVLGDSWEWNGAAWAPVPLPGPSARAETAMAYDSARAQTLLFGGGGTGSNSLGDTWAYGSGWAWFMQQPQSAAVAEGSGVVLSVDAAGSGPLSYRWRLGGAPLVDGAGVQGAATRTLTIQHASMASVGAYDCVISTGCTSAISAPASVSVQGCYANCDASTTAPVLNVNDFICYLNRFTAGCS